MGRVLFLKSGSNPTGEDPGLPAPDRSPSTTSLGDSAAGPGRGRGGWSSRLAHRRRQPGWRVPERGAGPLAPSPVLTRREIPGGGDGEGGRRGSRAGRWPGAPFGSPFTSPSQIVVLPAEPRIESSPGRFRGPGTRGGAGGVSPGGWDLPVALRSAPPSTREKVLPAGPTHTFAHLGLQEKRESLWSGRRGRGLCIPFFLLKGKKSRGLCRIGDKLERMQVLLDLYSLTSRLPTPNLLRFAVSVGKCTKPCRCGVQPGAGCL